MHPILRVAALMLVATACTASTRGMRSTQSLAPVAIAVHNGSDKHTMLPVWVNFDGKEVPMGLIQPGTTWRERTFLTHVWRIYALPFTTEPNSVHTAKLNDIAAEFVVTAETPVLIEVE